MKFNNQPAPPKVGVTAAESGTYTDFANINTGGLKPDGSDGVNELTYLILDVIDEMQAAAALLQPATEQEEPGPIPETRAGNRAQGLGTALHLQRRHGGGGVVAAGQVD